MRICLLVCKWSQETVVFLSSSLSHFGGTGVPLELTNWLDYLAASLGFHISTSWHPDSRHTLPHQAFYPGPRSQSHSSKLARQAHFHSTHYSKP